MPSSSSRAFPGLSIVSVACAAGLMFTTGCDRGNEGGNKTAAHEQPQGIIVGVANVERHPIQQSLTISSELVPFQEIDVYAKEAGYVKELLVDYGTHVKAGQLMAVLEIPELVAQIDQDKATIRSMQDQVSNAEHELNRIEAQHKVFHLQYERLNGVAQSKPGLVAQQEVDDVQGKDLEAEAQVEGGKSNLEAARSNLAASQAKLTHDEALYAYSRITAPFDGVVTQRNANLGTLMQAGTSSSTQAMPLVRLSEEKLYRLVIPVAESYVAYIKTGDAVNVLVPSLHKSFPGKVARLSLEVHDSTRTMHTEVDVPNPTGEMLPGLYAQATLKLSGSQDALTIPMQAIDRQGERTTALIVDPANKVQERQITLGIEGETENDTEVMSGLNAGERVIVSDRAGLKLGQEVRPQAAPPASYNGKG